MFKRNLNPTFFRSNLWYGWSCTWEETFDWGKFIGFYFKVYEIWLCWSNWVMHRLSSVSLWLFAFHWTYYLSPKKGYQSLKKNRRNTDRKEDSTVCMLIKMSSYLTIIFTFHALSFLINIFDQRLEKATIQKSNLWIYEVKGSIVINKWNDL